MVDELRLSLFADSIGEPYRLTDAEPPIDFVLMEAEPLRSGVRSLDPERNFSLVFEGPADRPLDQQIVTLAHDASGEVALFVVPIAEHDDRRRYEAVINRA